MAEHTLLGEFWADLPSFYSMQNLNIGGVTITFVVWMTAAALVLCATGLVAWGLTWPVRRKPGPMGLVKAQNATMDILILRTRNGLALCSVALLAVCLLGLLLGLGATSFFIMLDLLCGLFITALALGYLCGAFWPPSAGA
ncbi:hypothetical protein E3E12_04010 [Formicincola oecophyllae]|uniref:Uncharacterized protein n=1 Tax=Formicincola oecophyllae TaxID=2558361 RepID=A0A4Y6U923_9PROT|nr:hypothetical protein [Formicincola oecophyllae]QDH13500.1 hypothetical protein E3E12_04010 [Formicincola oecophyllae]